MSRRGTDSKSRSIFRPASLLTALALALTTGAHRVDSAAGLDPPLDVPDLRCPSGPSTPSSGSRSTSTPDSPPETEYLGGLSRLVEAEAPRLDPLLISDFNLQSTRSSAPRPRRFAFWGDSHLAAAVMTEELGRFLRQQGVTVGSRFLPPTMGRAGVRLPIRAHCLGRSWSRDLAYLAPEGFASGPGLANLRATAGAESYLWLDLRNRERQPIIRGIQIVYQATAVDSEVAISINEGPEQIIRLANAELGVPAQSAFIELERSALLSTVKLRVLRGQLVLHGFALDHDRPPLVTLDVFGMPSATVRGWAAADPTYLEQTLGSESYDAIVLQYGTNEGNVSPFDRAKYAAGLVKALTHVRQVFPTASCLLIGPTDRGVLVKRTRSRRAATDYLKFARIHREITVMQAEIGAQFGCAAWDWQAYMGGLGGSYGWANSSPTLMARDLTHLTPTGYRRTGAALARSLGWDR